jgi:hypothetical protein
MTEENENQTYDLEDRLIDFAVRIIRMAESLLVTSTRTAKNAQKKFS